MPTQRHRWLTLPDSRDRRRVAAMRTYVLDEARRDYARRHTDPTLAPVVALIAAYEAETNLGDVLKAVPDEVAGLPVATLVVVDGGEDGTARVAEEAGVHTCVLPVNLGQGAALRLGYALALEGGAQVIATLDADGQNDPTELETMVRPIVDGEADFVIASRRLGVDQTTDRFRRAGVRLYAALLNAIVGQRLSDSSNGYRSFRAELVADLLPRLRQDQYQTAEVVIVAGTRGWRITQRPTVWHPRASGSSKKGGNLVFGVQYLRVILTTWARVTLGNHARR